MTECIFSTPDAAAEECSTTVEVGELTPAPSLETLPVTGVESSLLMPLGVLAVVIGLGLKAVADLVAWWCDAEDSELFEDEDNNNNNNNKENIQ